MMHLTIIASWCINWIFVKQVFIIREMITVPCFFFLPDDDSFMRPKEGIPKSIKLLFIYLFWKCTQEGFFPFISPC